MLIFLSFHWNQSNTEPWVLKLSFVFDLFIVVTYEIRVFFEGAQKEVFSSILKKAL
jgi:hypothetical protein